MVFECLRTDAVRFRILVHSPEQWWADQLSARLARLPALVTWTDDRETFLSMASCLPYLRLVTLDLSRASSEESCLELVAEVRRRRDNVTLLVLLPYRWKWLAPYLYCAGASRVFVSAIPPEVADLIESSWSRQCGER